MGKNNEIKRDFQCTYNYLSNLNFERLVMENATRDFLRQIHKAAYIFDIWRIGLEKANKNNVSIDEIFSSFVQIMYICVLKDDKILYMLYRNVIDNLIKVCKERYLVTNSFTIDALIDLQKINKDNEITSKAFESILTLYKISCGYVHSTEEKYLKLDTCLKEYGSLELSIFDQCNKHFCTLAKNINYIFLFMYDEVYEMQLNPKEKQLINSFCNKDILKKIFLIKYGVQY